MSQSDLATWWKQKTPGTTYWRCQVPALVLPGRVVALDYGDIRPHPTNHTGYGFPRQEGTAIWQFPGSSTRATLMVGMQRLGIRTLVEVDDNYLIQSPPQPNRVRPWLTKMDASDQNAHSIELHREIVRHHCDGVIVATPELERRYLRLNPNVWVCPNSVYTPDWPQEPPSSPDGVLRIGWAASDSHLADAKMVAKALEWASRQPNVEVTMLGADPGWTFPYQHVPWTNTLAGYRKSLEQLDVGICPVKSSVWHDCKSDVKALEYAMAGAMPLVQRSEPYRPWLDMGWPAASTEKQWRDLIHWVVTERDQASRWAREARAYALAERTIEKNIHLWRTAIGLKNAVPVHT